MGTDRVVRKKLVWVTPVRFCGMCPSYFCCHWIFLLGFSVVFFFPPLNVGVVFFEVKEAIELDFYYHFFKRPFTVYLENKFVIPN